MDLTPELLRTVEFGEAKKGYDLDEVDEFLDRAATDLARQHTRLRELEQRVTDAETRAAEAEGAARDRGDSDETLRRTLVLAQRTADAAIKEAQDEAARIVAEARQKADGMIASAEEQVRREVGATRDRLQAEIRDLETRRGQLHDRIVELSAHLDTERDRLRQQVDQLREALDDEALRVAAIPGADPDPQDEASEPVVDLSAPMTAGPADTTDVADADEEDEDLADLPPPPVGWDGPASADEPEAEAEVAPAGALFAPRPDDDVVDGGPPTQATPVVGADPDDVGSSHLDELRRAVREAPEPEPADDDAAMAAFFDQDDEEERTRRFGRRR